MKKTKEEIIKKVRKIVTYHSEGGTSGYLLSGKQIDDISKLIDEAEKRGYNKAIKKTQLALEKKFPPVTKTDKWIALILGQVYEVIEQLK